MIFDLTFMDDLLIKNTLIFFLMLSSVHIFSEIH